MAPPQQCCPYQLLSRSSTVLNEQSSDSPRGRRRRQLDTQARGLSPGYLSRTRVDKVSVSCEVYNLLILLNLFLP